MVQERIVETTDAQGTVVERAYERDTGPASVTVNTAPSGSSGFSAVLGILLLIGIAVAGYLLFTNNSSEERKENAVAEAAGDVGAAAEKAGAAVEKAADKIAN
jgi:hypothetical protein